MKNDEVSKKQFECAPFDCSERTSAMRPPLWYLFAVQAVLYSLACAFIAGVIVVVLAPAIAWLFIHQWQWATFGVWLLFTLFGIPFGIFVAGMDTLNEWTKRTTASVPIKVTVFAITSTVLVAGLLYVAENVGLYVYSHYPPEISAKTATENNPNDATNPYTSLINSGGSNTIGGIPISSPSPTNPNRAK